MHDTTEKDVQMATVVSLSSKNGIVTEKRTAVMVQTKTVVVCLNYTFLFDLA